MIESVGGGIPPLVYIALMLPVLGMGIGALAIWTEHKRKEAVLDILKIYAEKGEEPAPEVLAGLSQAVSNKAPDDGTSETGWRKFAFFVVMSIGFGGTSIWTYQWGADGWLLTIGFAITSFVMAAFATSKLVQALTGPKNNAR